MVLLGWARLSGSWPKTGPQGSPGAGQFSSVGAPGSDVVLAGALAGFWPEVGERLPPSPPAGRAAETQGCGCF